MNSTDIGEIAGALALAQGEFPAIEKTKVGKVEGQSKGSGRDYKFEYKYADISDVLSAVRPVLAKHDIALLQLTEVDDANVMHVRTRLVHKSGQWIESTYPVCSIGMDHQKMGGALTYARRYALCSIVGVAAEDDLDGQGAGTVESKGKRKSAPSATLEERQAALNAAKDQVALEAVWDTVAADWDNLPSEWQLGLKAAVTQRQHELKAAALKGGEFPGDMKSQNFDNLDTGPTPEQVEALRKSGALQG